MSDLLLRVLCLCFLSFLTCNICFANVSELTNEIIAKEDSLWANIDLEAVAEDESMLVFCKKDRKIHCYLINDGQIQSFENEAGAVAKQIAIIDTVMGSFYKKNFMENQLRYEGAARKLYHLLIHPFKSNLKTKVAIISDPSLSIIPWDGLITKKQSTGELPNYLLFEHEIRIIDASKAICLQKEQEPALEFLGFAPQFEGWLSLNNEKEIDAVSQNLEKLVFKERLDNRNVFKCMQEVRSKVIHFSSHAQIDQVSDLESGIVLDNGSQRLTIDMILHLQLDTDLVFLNTCESAKPGRNEHSSITEAFLVAGAKAVVGTLWKVDDSAAMSIACSTYEGIKKGETTGEALRSAKIQFIKSAEIRSKAHPFYWSAYQLYGQSEVIFEQSDLKYKKWLSLGFTILTGVSMANYYFGSKVKRMVLDQNWT